MIAATWDWVPYDYCNFEALMCSNRMRNFFKSRDRLRVFAADRNWDQFHNPKNLAMALVVEAGELVEPFQWLTEEQSLRLDSKQRCHVQNEVADVFIYLIRLADKLGIDWRFQEASAKSEA